jgi:hypothetical protein
MAGFEFESRLRRALSEAAEREAQRGPRARAVATAHSALDATRRSLVPATAAIVATVLVLAIAAVYLARSGPQREAVRPPEVVARLALADALGGTVGAYGSVWMADTDRARLLRIDPASRQVTARLPVQNDLAMAPAGSEMWVLNQNFPPPRGAFRDLLLRIDPSSSEVVARLPLRTPSGQPFAGLDLAADEDSVWILGTTPTWHNNDTMGAIRVDARTGRVTAAVALPGGWGRVGIALRRDGLWAITADSRLLRFDSHTGKKLSETQLNPPLDGESEPTDGRLQFAGGTLVTSTPGALAGVDPYTGQVVWRRHLGQSVLAWTEADGLIWAAVSPQGPDRLVALDPEDGHVATSVGLEAFGVAGIASIGDELWTATAGGEAIVLRR